MTQKKILNFQREYTLFSIISMTRTNPFRNSSFRTSFYFSPSKVHLNSQKLAYLSILILSRGSFKGSIADRIPWKSVMSTWLNCWSLENKLKRASQIKRLKPIWIKKSPFNSLIQYSKLSSHSSWPQSN